MADLSEAGRRSRVDTKWRLSVLGLRRGAAHHGCSRLSRRPLCSERSLGFSTARPVSVGGRGAASKGGCSPDWLPHVGAPAQNISIALRFRAFSVSYPSHLCTRR